MINMFTGGLEFPKEEKENVDTVTLHSISESDLNKHFNPIPSM